MRSVDWHPASRRYYSVLQTVIKLPRRRTSTPVAVTPPSTPRAEDVLKFWRLNHHKFPTWAKAARIIFSLVASAAASERVFALVKTMFGEEQLSSLADLVQAALMLRKNERIVG